MDLMVGWPQAHLGLLEVISVQQLLLRCPHLGERGVRFVKRVAMTARSAVVAGLVLSLSPQVAQVRLSDPAGRTMTVSSDEVCGAAVGDGKLHHVVVIADTQKYSRIDIV